MLIINADYKIMVEESSQKIRFIVRCKKTNKKIYWVYNDRKASLICKTIN